MVWPYPKLSMGFVAGLCLWLAGCQGLDLRAAGEGRFSGGGGSQRHSLQGDLLSGPLEVQRWPVNGAWTPLAHCREWKQAGLALTKAHYAGPDLEPVAARWHAARDPAGLGAGATRVRKPHPARLPSHGPFDAALLELAHRPTLSGWTATIEYSRRWPEAALDEGLARTLEGLVIDDATWVPGDDGSSWSDLQRLLRRDGKEKGVPVPVGLRCAAAETWCDLIARGSVDPEQDCAGVGRALQEGVLPEAVQAELFRGLSRRIAPDRVPKLMDALTNSTVEGRELRLAALDGCLAHAVAVRESNAPAERFREVAGSSWLQQVRADEGDADETIRRRALEILAVLRDDEAVARCRSRLSDQSLGVQETAACGLGLVGSAEAIAILKEQAKSTDERTRMLAARGLAIVGPEQLQPLIDDTPRVRMEIAQRLAGGASPGGGVLLKRLLADANPEVQLAAVRSAVYWPDDLVTPLLLQCLVEGALRTRKVAVEDLESRYGVVMNFPLEQPAAERELAARKWGREWHVTDSVLAEAAWRLGQGTASGATAERVVEVEKRLAMLPDDLQNQALEPSLREWFERLGEADVGAVEGAAREAQGARGEFLKVQVLPRISPAWKALQDLGHRDLAVRRRGASQLRLLGQAATLSAGVVNELAERLKVEQDGLVWRLAIESVAQDGSPEAAHIAQLALANTWPDVRILGCAYLSDHGRSAQGAWLLPLFEDPNRNVRLAAVAAAGRCGNPIVLDGAPGSTQRGLRALLASEQGHARVQVAAAMSRLGDRQGMDELGRIAAGDDAQLRMAAAEAMGSTGQTRFVAVLISHAWTERHGQVQSTMLASLERLVPVEEQPVELKRAQTPHDAAAAWAEWWSRRSAAETAPGLTSGVPERGGKSGGSKGAERGAAGA